MINVTLGAADTQKEKPFPKLMISYKGTIILFHKPEYGFVIRPRSSTNNELTDSPDGWLMKDFTDYNEPITIQNA